MIVKTEEDAREMRCCGPEGCGEGFRPGMPMQRLPTTITEVGTQSVKWALPRDRFCIGKHCMAFRENVIDRQTTPLGYMEGYLEPSHADGWRIKRSVERGHAGGEGLEWIRTDGFFCGLVGKPS